MKLKAGDRLPSFTLPTHKREALKLPEDLTGRTVLWVIRYIGCTVCRYDVQLLAESYDRIRAKGCELFVVMQSDVAHVSRELAASPIPFEIVCDSKLEFYHALQISPAADKEELGGDDPARLMAKRDAAIARGFSHGDYEGDELQLPALFILGADGTVELAHYGRSIVDMPTVDELVEML